MSALPMTWLGYYNKASIVYKGLRDEDITLKGMISIEILAGEMSVVCAEMR